MSLVVRQVENPEAEEPTIIHSSRAILEADGSLNTSQLDFVKPGDQLMAGSFKNFWRYYGFSAHRHSDCYCDPEFLVSPHPCEPPLIPAGKFQRFVRHINGEETLTLISPTDYEKVLERRLAEQRAVMKAERSRDRRTLKRRIYLCLTGQGKRRPTIVLIRQVRYTVNHALQVVRSCEITLNAHRTFDVSKVNFIKPGELYWAFDRHHDHDGHVCHAFIYPRVNHLEFFKPISSTMLQKLYHRVEGIQHDVITIISDPDKKAMWRRKNGLKSEV